MIPENIIVLMKQLTSNTVIEERGKEKLKTDKKEGIPHIDPKTMKDVRSSKMTSRRKIYQTSNISNKHIKQYGQEKILLI